MLVHTEFPPRNGRMKFSSVIGSAERTLEILSDAHPSILHPQRFVVSLPNAGSQPCVFPPCQFCSNAHAIKRTLCVPRDLCWEAATLRQTQLSGAGRAHSGKVRLVSALKLQLGWRREGVPTQTALPSPSTHHHHYHNYNRRRPRRFVFSIVFKHHSVATTRQSTAER